MAEREGDVADWRGGVMAGGLLAEQLWERKVLGRRSWWAGLEKVQS